MLKLIFLLVIGLATCLPHPAMAILMDSGEPFETGSWDQAFNESGVGSFDTIEVYMLSVGDNFKNMVFRNFTNGGWSDWADLASESLETSHAVASGPSLTNLTFNIHFAGDKADSLEFNFLAWAGEDLKEAANAKWEGGRWLITAFTAASNYTSPNSNAPVPEPATMLLLGSGLVGLASFRKKFRKSKSA